MIPNPIPLEQRVVLWSDEAAAYLGLSQATVEQLAKKGELPHGRLGGPKGRYLFRLDALRRWAETVAPDKAEEGNTGGVA